MPGGGNRQLRLRLREDHWVWTIQDAVTRRREVERALEFYAAYGDKEVKQALEFYAAYRSRLDELRQAVEEIRQAVREGGLARSVSEAKPQGGGGDERLFAALDKFLNF